jgi:hypothetical protein
VRIRIFVALALSGFLLCPALRAQASTSESPCAQNAVSIPSRPTVTSATDTTQCGVVEVEYGLERQWPGGRANRDDLTGGLRWGITPSLDFHWVSSNFVHLMDTSGNRTGYGDSWLGLRYRFLKQTRRRPSLGVFYGAKMPTANTAMRLGTGQPDHSISFLASKDVSKLHFDFNVIELLAGCTSPGIDHNTGLALATWLPLTRRVSAVFEPYGYTTLNAGSLAYASATTGFNYRVHRRLYLDSGLDLGVTSAAAHQRVFVGITYALGNVYSFLRPQL